MQRPPRDGSTVIKKSNLLILDGNAVFKQGFLGAKNEYNHRGEHIGGVYQFLTVLRKLLTEDLYHRVYVFWDGKFSGKLRYDLYSLYKSGRGKDYENGTFPTDESEIRQKKQIWNYLEELCIRQIQDYQVEADDFIGWFCTNKKKNEHITIVTTDRDMCQLINDTVRIYFCDLRKFITPENYNEHFQHHIENAALIKTIIGDNSDTIKGIKGVKEKTLIELFPELKERKLTINGVLERAKLLKSERQEAGKSELKSLTNILERNTDGPQGKDVYLINEKIVNLKNPLMTEEAIKNIKDLINGTISQEGRGTKNAMIMMKQDGLERTIGPYRYADYLVPYKQLMDRENKFNN